MAYQIWISHFLPLSLLNRTGFGRNCQVKCVNFENLKKEAFLKMQWHVKLIYFSVLDNFCTFDSSAVRFYSAYTKKASASKLIQNDWAGKIEKSTSRINNNPTSPLLLFCKKGEIGCCAQRRFFYFPAKKGGKEGEEEFTGHSLKRRDTHFHFPKNKSNSILFLKKTSLFF